MKVVSWNMGCAPPGSRYRKTHPDAWRYLLQELKPDVAFIQEALFDAPDAEAFGTLFWSEEKGNVSGTAALVRHGLAAERLTIKADGSYVAGVQVPLAGYPASFVSVHVGPGYYPKLVRVLIERLTASVAGHRFVVGGDLNAARRVDEVYGGKRYTRIFETFAAREFHDCHWAQHGKEVQSLWRRPTEQPYQCDHIFVDRFRARGVVTCDVINNPEVRGLSDHGPLQLEIDETRISQSSPTDPIPRPATPR
jgi:endonuclease/exonuclease/phosphatase family metal-dependent hydrolase